MSQRDALRVRIEKLKKARLAWLDVADELVAPIDNTGGARQAGTVAFDRELTTSPAMPGGLKLLITRMHTATTNTIGALQDGASSTRECAHAVGVVAGLYQTMEEQGEQEARRVGQMVEEPR